MLDLTYLEVCRGEVETGEPASRVQHGRTDLVRARLLEQDGRDRGVVVVVGDDRHDLVWVNALGTAPRHVAELSVR